MQRSRKYVIEGHHSDIIEIDEDDENIEYESRESESNTKFAGSATNSNSKITRKEVKFSNCMNCALKETIDSSSQM